MPVDVTAFSHTVTCDLDQEGAIARVEEALAAEGFGVLTRIDVQATMKNKLGVERDPYVILGACNPKIAHGALQAEPLLGVLLPCNVVVHQQDGVTKVSAVDAGAMLGVVGNDALQGAATEVDARLGRVLQAVAAG
ncbi:MAG TPA: DUF302 domain-containing protein [Miltoncostaeaceae bacterium]|nr:DUF302 domain-containing protein [Miltoncostaeaceae bacterium]